MSRRKNGTGSICKEGEKWRLRGPSINGVQEEVGRLAVSEYTKDEAHALLDYYVESGIKLFEEPEQQTELQLKETIKELTENIEELSTELTELKSKLLDQQTESEKLKFIIKQQEELIKKINNATK